MRSDGQYVDERSAEERAASMRRRLAVIQMELATLASALERVSAEADALGITHLPEDGPTRPTSRADADDEPEGWWSVVPVQALATMAAMVVALAIVLALIG